MWNCSPWERPGPVESRTPRSDRSDGTRCVPEPMLPRLEGPQVSPPLRFRPVPCALQASPDPQVASLTESRMIGMTSAAPPTRSSLPEGHSQWLANR